MTNSLLETELGCLSHGIISKWFNLRAGLSSPVAAESSSSGLKSQSLGQRQSTPGCESTRPGEKAICTSGSESIYTGRKKKKKKNTRMCLPSPTPTLTGLNRIGPQPRKSTGNLCNDFREFESCSKTHRFWWYETPAGVFCL